MWPAVLEAVRLAGAVFLCGVTVKLLDDYLDQDLDYRTGHANWAYYLGKSTPIYALVAFALAAALHYLLAVSLFLASYIIGMTHEMHQLLPSKLSGWQESLLALSFGVLLCGWHPMLFSLLFIGAVQIFDDCCDYYLDAMAGVTSKRNVARLLGPVEAVLLTILLLMLAWYLQESYFISSLVGTSALMLLFAARGRS